MLAEIDELTIRCVGRMASERIRAGSQDLWDFVLVAYARATPEKRQKLVEVLARGERTII